MKKKRKLEIVKPYQENAFAGSRWLVREGDVTLGEFVSLDSATTFKEAMEREPAVSVKPEGRWTT